MKSVVEKTQMNTLVECMTKLIEDGYTENFLITGKALVANDGKKYNPDQVRIVNFYRFEGESDPADSSILYAIETSDKKKGTISDAYGPYSDSKTTLFISEVEEINKKPSSENNKISG